MVAVTSRCATCRGRKIKCDQKWPCCGPCVESGRACPGPPRKVKFMPVNAATVKKKTTVTASELFQDLQSTKKSACRKRQRSRVHWTVELPNDDLVEGLQVFNSIPIELPLSMPSDSATLVATELVNSLQFDENSPASSFLGSCCFIKDVPRMLESSVALTATVACCLDASTKNHLAPRKCRTLDPKLYGRALAAINSALEQPSQRTCISTFLAVALIGRLESLLAPRQLARIPCWSVHAAGISELLKFRGVVDPSDRTVFLAILENFGPIIAHSVFVDQDCFLSSPDWQQALCSAAASTETTIDQILPKVFAQLAFLPNLIRAMRRYRKRDGDAFSGVRDLAMTMYSRLQAIGKIIENDIIPGVEVGLPSWLDIDAPMRQVYLNPTQDCCRAISWHAVMTLIVNKVLISLVESPTNDSNGWLNSYSAAVLRRQNRNICLRVWMLSEEARRRGLIEFYFYPGALSSTYDCAANDRERDWIVDLLNDILGSTWSQAKWTHDAVESVCLTLAGTLD